MPNSVLNLAYVRNYVRIKLGASSVAVELEDVDIDLCLADALLELNRLRPQVEYITKSVNSGQTTLGPFNSTETPGFQGVSHVEFVDSDLQDYPEDSTNPFTEELADSINAMGLGDYEQVLQLREIGLSITSQNPTYKALWTRDRQPDGSYVRNCYVAVYVPYQMDVTMTVSWHVTPDDDPATGLISVPMADVKWVLEYTLAHAKLVLSKIRGKFTGITGPDGDQPIDWDTLKEEGETRLRELDEELLSRRRLLPVVTG